MCKVPSGLWQYVWDDTCLVEWETGAITPFVYHVIECALDLLMVLYGYLLLGMLERQSVGVSPDGICPRHVVCGIEGAREGSLQGDNVLGSSSGMGCFSHFGFYGFEG